MFSEQTIKKTSDNPNQSTSNVWRPVRTESFSPAFSLKHGSRNATLLSDLIVKMKKLDGVRWRRVTSRSLANQSEEISTIERAVICRLLYYHWVIATIR